MATNVFRGDAQDQAQVNTHTVGGTPAAAQVYSVTINLKVVSYTATVSDTNSTIASALQTLLVSSDEAEFLEVSWTVSGAVITGTAATAGVPFTATSAATGTGTLVAATTTASAGHWHWDDPDNWSLGAVPVTGDDVWLINTTTSIKYGLAQSAVTLASLNADATFTGQLGLPPFNGNYYEYRATELAVGVTALNVGKGFGGGSGMMRINCGSVQSTWTVFSTGSPTSLGVPALFLRGTHASNVLNHQRGSVGVAVFPGHTATLATVRTSYVNSPATDVTLTLGPGCTLTTLNLEGGTVQLENNVTALNVRDATVTLLGTATVGTATIRKGGTVYYQSSGTLTAGSVEGGGELTFNRDLRARTVTNLTLYAAAVLRDRFKTVTFSNPFLLSGCELKDVTLDLGSNLTIART